MESLGQKLREAREKHNYNLEQVARDTNISKSYLEALEEENFGVIPGDTYVLGFLRNYAEYLGLNPEELVGLYRNLRIQEQPMPMSELLQGPGPRRRPRTVALVLVVAVLVAVGVFLLVRYGLPRRGGEPVMARQPASAPGEYVLTDEAVTRWYSQGESVNVPLDGEQFRVTFSQVGERLTLKVPGGTVDLTIGQTRPLDLDADSIDDIRVQLNDLDVTGSNRRANVSIFKLPRAETPMVASPQGDGAAGAQTGQAPGAATASGAPAATATAAASGAGSASGAGAPARPGAATVAAPAAVQAPASETPEEPVAAAPAASGAGFSGPVELQAASAPSPFRLSITFRGYVLLRYLADGENRDERFFHKGETFNLDVREEARLWISNAGALRLSVGGKDVELGRPGQVVARTIRWSDADDSGSYRLQVLASD